MSRIQDILAKAERDGTAGRLAARPLPQTTPTAVIPAELDGAAVLRRTAMAPAAAEPLSKAGVNLRTASATLHPALVAAIAPHAAAAEQYRSIRTRLTMREETGPMRTIGITSPGAKDGKSITAANLALAMAQEPQRDVVLVDANLRSPAVHALFAVERTPGFTEVLTGEAALEDALVHLPDLRLTLLPAGRMAEYPAELLSSGAMRRALDALGARFDRIVLDLPGVLPVADVGAAAPMTDGVLMVVRAGVTQRPSLDRALASLDPEKVVGVVLNERE